MGLDPRTLILTISALSLVLAGWLLLAGLHNQKGQGVWYWAASNLCTAAGFGIAALPIQQATAGWWIVTGSFFISAGAALQYAGILKFRRGFFGWHIPVLIIAATTAVTIWFALVKPDINARAITNSFIFAVVYTACAVKLLVPERPPLRWASWLTGAAFSAVALLLVGRAFAIAISPERTFALYAPQYANIAVFFAGSLLQLSLSFGFMLMLHYRLAEGLQQLASCDSLTGAINRRSLEFEGERLYAQALLSRRALAVMMIDVDHFKEINDRFGHAAGDEVLKRLSESAQKAIRAGDYFARYGGEEFCILLPSTSAEQAFGLAERLRKNWAETHLSFEEKNLQSTISIGVSDSLDAVQSFSELLSAADRELYRAKREGRNRVAANSPIVKPA